MVLLLNKTIKQKPLIDQQNMQTFISIEKSCWWNIKLSVENTYPYFYGYDDC